MTAARIRAQFPTSDGFGYQLKGCCRPPFVWASYNISRYIGRHSSRENNVPYYSHYSSSNTVPIIYPCGNFSDTSSLKFERTKGSIGHAFTVCIRTENQNQVSFYPFVLHEISVLIERYARTASSIMHSIVYSV